MVISHAIANPRTLLGDCLHAVGPARLAIATIGGWLALHLSGNLSHVFLAMSAALTAFGLINAAAVAGGAWFGPIRWPVLRRAYAFVRD